MKLQHIPSLIPSLLLAFAILLMTPVGIYTCGSLANSLVFMRGDDMLPFPCNDSEAVTLQLSETAVTSYISAPLAPIANGTGPVLSFLVFVVSFIIFAFKTFKRKPETPPPTFLFSI